MSTKNRKSRNARNRRDANKFGTYGQKLFFPVKRLDKDGKLIEEINVDALMAQDIDKSKYKNNRNRRKRGGSADDYSKLATKLKKSGKNVRYTKHE
jgi:hypothetical protein|tara:strand:+ start:645 stop:932 length:288 start_codon:yes stop_codon:yes gene_type:complete